MKNIETILSEAGITLTDEQKAAVGKAVEENYKPIADWQKQHDKAENLQEQLDTTKEEMKKFDGVDAAGMEKSIADLKKKLEDKELEHQTQIADRDFNDLLKDSIAGANGKNAKAIRALLDVDALKKSKNQKEDVAAALKTLAEAEDSKFLFAEPDPTVVGTGNPIGVVTKKTSASDLEEANMRAAMGLPATKEDK